MTAFGASIRRKGIKIILFHHKRQKISTLFLFFVILSVFRTDAVVKMSSVRLSVSGEKRRSAIARQVHSHT